jgi:GNAT superfamily N-acetyltransferase
MQIRVATRQDEPFISTIVFQSLQEYGIQPDLQGADSDLTNTERHYFWYDGLCLVAENDGVIAGVLAGRRRPGQEDILELCRLVVEPGARRRGVARALLKTMLFFAANLEYKTIVCAPPGRAAELTLPPVPVMEKLGFSKDDAGVWRMPVLSGR